MKGIGKKYNVLIGAVLLILCCMGGTFAYFTYKESIKNQFTVGYNEIMFNETYNPPEEIKVGETTFRKNIKVSNTGTIPCYIRVFCEFSDSDMKKYAKLTQDGIDWFPADELKENLLNDWAYIPEEEGDLGGYYYYKKIVEKKEDTQQLFDQVRISIPEGKGDDIKDFDIITYAESIQIKDYYANEYTEEDCWRNAWEMFLRDGGAE